MVSVMCLLDVLYTHMNTHPMGSDSLGSPGSDSVVVRELCGLGSQLDVLFAPPCGPSNGARGFQQGAHWKQQENEPLMSSDALC